MIYKKLLKNIDQQAILEVQEQSYIAGRGIELQNKTISIDDNIVANKHEVDNNTQLIESLKTQITQLESKIASLSQRVEQLENKGTK